MKDAQALRSCLNCGSELAGDYCSSCGQKAQIHASLAAFAHDLLHGVLHFEGRAWRTFLMLARRPGELTRRYVDGERTRFVSPVAMFLFSIFLMFSVFQAIGVATPADIGVPRESTVSGSAAAELAGGGAGDGTYMGAGKSGIAWLDHGLEKWRGNPSLMLYKFRSNSYKYSWILILLSLPFMMALFAGRKGVSPFHHVVFVTYSIAFMTVLMVALSVLHHFGAPPWTVIVAALLVPPTHIFVDLREAYRLTVAEALWRTAGLIASIALIIAIFLQVLWSIGNLD